MKAWNKLSHMKTKCLIPLMTLTLLFGSVTPAYAQSNEDKEEETTTDIVREIESTEVKEDPKPEPNPLTPDGNANILDEADSSQNKLFYTITTANGNNFYLIIDKDRNSQNVYMLSAIDEVDLKDFIEEEASEIPAGTLTGDDGLLTDEELTHQKEDEAKEDETEPGSETEEDPVPEKKANPFLSLLIVGAIALAGAGTFFFVKKKRSSDYSDDEDETIYGNPETEEVNEDSDDDIEIMEVEYPNPDDYPDESGLPKEDSDSDQ